MVSVPLLYRSGGCLEEGGWVYAKELAGGPSAYTIGWPAFRTWDALAELQPLVGGLAKIC